MHYSACCPKDHPRLSQAGPSKRVMCVSAVSSENKSPIGPTRCSKGWIPLNLVYGGCFEGDEAALPDKYWEQKC